MVPNEWLQTVVNIGDVSVCALVVLNLISVYYLHKNQSDESPSLYSTVKTWPDETKDRIVTVTRFYGGGLSVLLLCSALACSSATVQDFIKSHYFLTTLSTTLGLFLSMLFVHNFSYKDDYRAKVFFFVMHSILTTPTISTLGPAVCLKSAFCTLMVIGLLTIVALKANQDLHASLINPLSKLNLVVIGASIFVTLMGPPKNAIDVVILCFNIHLGFFFFAGMYIVNVQLLLKDCQAQDDKFDPIYIAAVMEISTLNLFLRLATLISLKMALHQI